jgi:hypothetical protein
MLIDFDSMEGTEEEKDYHQEVFSSIKLQISEM